MRSRWLLGAALGVTALVAWRATRRRRRVLVCKRLAQVLRPLRLCRRACVCRRVRRRQRWLAALLGWLHSTQRESTARPLCWKPELVGEPHLRWIMQPGMAHRPSFCVPAAGR